MKPTSDNPKQNTEKFSRLLPPLAEELLVASGPKLVTTIGLDVVRGAVLDVLSGKNLRDSTESLTRRRITTLNLAMTEMFARGSTQNQEDPLTP
jgi:hypothetical protein